MMSEPQLKKIRVVLPEDAWHGVEAEWVWAEKFKEDIYWLRNVPFYARGISYDDQVKVEDVNGTLQLAGVVARGGHSTYRIFAPKGQMNDRVQALIRKLNELHSYIEGANRKLLAVDVLPEADIHKVYSLLAEARSSGIIDFVLPPSELNIWGLGKLYS